jgi:hypothetical protein
MPLTVPEVGFPPGKRGFLDKGRVFADWPARLGLLALVMMVGIFAGNLVFARYLDEHTLIGIGAYSAIPGLYLIGALLLIISVLRARE